LCLLFVTFSLQVSELATIMAQNVRPVKVILQYSTMFSRWFRYFSVVACKVTRKSGAHCKACLDL